MLSKMLPKELHGGMAVVVLVVATSAIGGSQAPISVGLVRADGYLIPIATITPKLFEIPVETRVNGEPLPAEHTEWPFGNLEWTLTYGRGRTPVAIKTLEPLMVDSHCSDQAVWRTTLTLPPARKNVSPISKIGVAISAGAIEHPEDVIDRPDAASRRVARRIVQLTHAKEAERVAVTQRQYLPETGSIEGRASVAVRIERLRRHSMAGVSTYYFEATKAWGAALGGSLVTGWIVDTPAGLRDHDVKFKFNDDGHKENDRAIVWGLVRYQNRALWILEWHGYEWEYYTINDWPSGVERVNVDGGGC